MKLSLGLCLACAAVAAPAPREDARVATAREVQDPPSVSRLADELASGEHALALAGRDAFERGLAYLAQRQRSQQDGTFPRDGGQVYVPVPLAALGALAYMAGGSAPERGPYGAGTAAAIDYLLDHTDLGAGAQARGYIATEGDGLSRMHGHGFATVALAMAWTQSPKTPRGERTAGALRAAVDVIQASQGVEGGWYYEPRRIADHENSVTVVLLQALRSARNAGVAVDSAVITRAVDYVVRCQNPNGAFRYTLEQTSDTSAALTAAGITTLHAAGRYDGAPLLTAQTSLAQELAQREELLLQRARHTLARSPVKYPHYERLYVALALWGAHERAAFERWYLREVEALVAEQAEDGSWRDAEFGASYATAMNCIVLALPQQLLPLFER